MQTRVRVFRSGPAVAAKPADGSCAVLPAGVGVIDVGRRLDARAAERMKARFKRLSRHGHSRHVIDLSNIDDLDSGGLAGLISTLRAVRESGGTIHLVASSERVTHVLELTALTRLFRVHPSLQEALEVMAAAAG